MKNVLITIDTIIGILLLIVFMVASAVGGNYNRMVSLREEARTQEAEIENSMQRRADLVPQLVGATKGAMSQERAVFENIAKAHAAFTNAPSGTVEKMQTGDALSTAIRGYMVVAQQYPNLQSMEIIKDLNVTIEGTENRIAVSRTRYNDAVQSYNQKIQSFPTNFFAGMFGFTQMQRFEMDSRAKEVPNVNLDFESK